MQSAKKLMQRKPTTENQNTKLNPVNSEASEEKLLTGDKLELFNKFKDTLNELNQISAIYRYIRNCYFDFFKEHPPADQHIELIKVRLEYALVKKGYEDAGVDVPDFVKQNYEAGQKWDVEAFTPGIKQILKPALQSNKEEQMTTATKTRVVSPEARAAFSKAVGTQETVTQSYVRLFSENLKSKLTDKQIAQKLRTLHPGKKQYSEDDVKSVRGMYNRGKLAGQKAQPVEAFVHVAKG